MCCSPTSEVSKVSLTHTRLAEAAVKGRCDATTAEILDIFPYNVRTKRRNEEIMQVKIRGKQEKYMSTLRMRTDMKV